MKKSLKGLRTLKKYLSKKTSRRRAVPIVQSTTNSFNSTLRKRKSSLTDDDIENLDIQRRSREYGRSSKPRLSSELSEFDIDFDKFFNFKNVSSLAELNRRKLAKLNRSRSSSGGYKRRTARLKITKLRRSRKKKR